MLKVAIVKLYWCHTHLVILPVDEGQLEAVLRGVNGEHPGLAVAVQAVDVAAPHHCDVDGQVQCADDTKVTDDGREEREREIVREWVCGCRYTHVRVSESESESEYIIQHGCTERQSL